MAAWMRYPVGVRVETRRRPGAVRSMGPGWASASRAARTLPVVSKGKIPILKQPVVSSAPDLLDLDGLPDLAPLAASLLDGLELPDLLGVVPDIPDPTAPLVPALEGTDYLVSCVPLYATESQYPLIWAAREAGVERFVLL